MENTVLKKKKLTIIYDDNDDDSDSESNFPVPLEELHLPALPFSFNNISLNTLYNDK